MTNLITNIVVEVMPHFEGYVYPERGDPATAVEHSDRPLSLHHGPGGGGVHHGLAGARLQREGAGAGVSAVDADGVCVPALRAAAAAVSPRAIPERCFEVMMTPHLTSPMAIFGFVYAWYLMAVLLLELWFDYRRDFVHWSETHAGLPRHALSRSSRSG